MVTDTEVILNALQKERDELHDKIMQVDRIIKRVKSLEYVSEPVNKIEDKASNNKPTSPVNIFPQKVDIKVQILRVFDIIGIASPLKDIQAEYNKISGNTYSIRDIVRTLHKNRLLKMVMLKNGRRGFMWIKSEWLENGELPDNRKPDGFDLLYKADNLIYE